MRCEGAEPGTSALPLLPIPPDGIFLPNLDLIAKLEQEEKQWEADLCSPNGEGFHSGENCKGDRRVKRAQDMPQEDGNA